MEHFEGDIIAYKQSSGAVNRTHTPGPDAGIDAVFAAYQGSEQFVGTKDLSALLRRLGGPAFRAESARIWELVAAVQAIHTCDPRPANFFHHASHHPY
jgi:hypothetical protein